MILAFGGRSSEKRSTFRYVLLLLLFRVRRAETTARGRWTRAARRPDVCVWSWDLAGGSRGCYTRTSARAS